MSETPAKKVRGFLLYNPITDKYWFRVYDETDRRKYTDYALHAEDIEVTIESTVLSLYEGEGKNRLDWSSRYLHKEKKDGS